MLAHSVFFVLATVTDQSQNCIVAYHPLIVDIPHSRGMLMVRLLIP